jgi:hypothetical protein
MTTTTRIAGVSVIVFAAVGCAAGGGGAVAQPSDPYSISTGYDSGGGGYPPYAGPAAKAMTTPEEMDCALTAPTYQQVSAFGKCVACHASSKTGAERKSAPPAVNFDTQAAAEANAQAAVSMVRAAAMPPAGSGLTLTEAEKGALYAWAMCGD